MLTLNKRMPEDVFERLSEHVGFIPSVTDNRLQMVK